MSNVTIAKTTVWMRNVDFEFVVMLFGLTTNPVVFMNLINRVFCDYSDKFIKVFIDNILVDSRSHEKHEKHLRFTLKRLREKQLYRKFSKY